MPTITDAQAVQVLREANDKTFSAQNNAQVAAVGSQLTAKQANLSATRQQVAGDKFSSISKVAASGLGMTLNYKLSLQASKMSATPPAGADQTSSRAAHGAGLTAATQGNGVGTVVGNAGDALDQAAGGAAMSSQAKVDSKLAEMQDTMASQALETAKANKEKASKAFESADDFAKGFFDRAKQVLDKLF